jgi:dUTP pyrophosphatase
MELKIKKLVDNAIIPSYAKDGDAGLDLTVISKSYIEDGVIYGTGLAFALPKDHVGLLFPRSSIYKKDQSLSNSVGVLDQNYRGEVKAIFKYTSDYIKSGLQPVEYEVGERALQLIVIPYPKMEIVEVDQLDETKRGTGGFGSTGK